MDTNTLLDATHKNQAENIKNDGLHVRRSNEHGLAACECVGSCIIFFFFFFYIYIYFFFSKAKKKKIFYEILRRFFK